MSKNTTTIKQFKASMITNGTFGRQISRNKAFNSAPRGVEIGKTVFQTANHCTGVSNTMSNACSGHSIKQAPSPKKGTKVQMGVHIRQW